MGTFHTCVYTHKSIKILKQVWICLIFKKIKKTSCMIMIIWYLDCDTVTWRHPNTKNIYFLLGIIIFILFWHFTPTPHLKGFIKK